MRLINHLPGLVGFVCLILSSECGPSVQRGCDSPKRPERAKQLKLVEEFQLAS